VLNLRAAKKGKAVKLHDGYHDPSQPNVA
jgi:hypothetical protein